MDKSGKPRESGTAPQDPHRNVENPLFAGDRTPERDYLEIKKYALEGSSTDGET